MAIAYLLLIGTSPLCAGEEVLVNGDFETGTSSWIAIGSPTISSETNEPFEGCCAGRVEGRTNSWNGIGQDLTSKLIANRAYTLSVMIKLTNAIEDSIKVTLRVIDDNGTTWSPLAQGTARQDEWREFVGAFTYSPNGTATSIQLYIEGPAAGVGYLADSARFTLLDDQWTQEANARIDTIRKRDMRIEVADVNGCPLPGAKITLQQTRNHFAFGAAVSHLHMNNPLYTDFLKENYEWAVMENATKWPQNQPNNGPPTYANADLIVNFCKANNIRMRGHCVTWANPIRVPKWAAALDNASLFSAIESRFESVITKYQHDFEHWDINNEMITNSFFQDRFGPAIRSWMFNRAHEIDPDLICMVNDFSVISSNRQTSIVQQVQKIESLGATVDAIGVQGHFNYGPPKGETILARLDNVATAKKPIWITEFDCEVADETLRADALETLYRAAFSHPSVKGVFNWGFWAGSMNAGADAAIVDLDWTINEAGVRYQSLRDEWRTVSSGITNSKGQFSTRGFHGEYDVIIEFENQTLQTTLTLTPEATEEFITSFSFGTGDCLPCLGDITLDGVVSGEDLGALLSEWGQCTTENCASDINDDGNVNGADIGLLISSWGQCP